MARGTRAFIDLAALRANAGATRAMSPGSRLMAVVKADAYGHGARAVALALQNHVDAFAVASLGEAVDIQEAGIERPVLLLEGTHDAGELGEIRERGLWLAATSEAQVAEIEGAGSGPSLQCWLKIDTGMHRLGVEATRAAELFQRLQACGCGKGTPVLFSHYACADEPDHPANEQQERRFEAATAGLHAPRSFANSAAIMTRPQTRLDWIRPGYMLYGGNPLRMPHPVARSLPAVMTLESRIIALRQVATGEGVGYGQRWRAARSSHIATVAIGYGDGYPRTARDGTPVLVRGQEAPLAGRVSMDMITVDVTGVDGAAVGDRVVLWGEGLSVDHVAAFAGTIGYALLTGMSRRVPRVHLDSTSRG